jgi:hypothetical protein
VGKLHWEVLRSGRRYPHVSHDRLHLGTRHHIQSQLLPAYLQAEPLGVLAMGAHARPRSEWVEPSGTPVPRPAALRAMEESGGPAAREAR